jgi:glutamyl-tRNA synthetase
MTYSLASVVDDIEYGITHIIRGEDHISNSAMHIQMFAALGARPPEFAHTSLLKSKDGEMSKRLGGFDIKSLREKGIEPMAILSFLAKIGTSDAVEIRNSLSELIAEFSLHKFSKATAFYDEQELSRLSTKFIHQADFASVNKQLNELGLYNVDEEFWLAVRPNISKLSEVRIWHELCSEDLLSERTDPELLEVAARLLPEELTINSWDEWISAIQQHIDRRGKNLFMPIRLALTGMQNGPELRHLLPLISRDVIKNRLLGKSRP